jgi:hypothetical protein
VPARPQLLPYPSAAWWSMPGSRSTIRSSTMVSRASRDDATSCGPPSLGLGHDQSPRLRLYRAAGLETSPSSPLPPALDRFDPAAEIDRGGPDLGVEVYILFRWVRPAGVEPDRRLWRSSSIYVAAETSLGDLDMNGDPTRAATSELSAIPKKRALLCRLRSVGAGFRRLGGPPHVLAGDLKREGEPRPVSESRVEQSGLMAVGGGLSRVRAERRGRVR